jgi:hypothetical protein
MITWRGWGRKGRWQMFEIVTVRNTGSRRGGSSRRGDIKGALGYARYPQRIKSQADQVCFSFGINLMKEARFIVGDRLRLQFDKEGGLGLWDRVPADSENSYIITKATSRNYGKVHLPAMDIFPCIRRVINLENVRVGSEGILFVWPKMPEGDEAKP